MSVTGPKFTESGNDHNVVLWLDHRPVEETKKINNTKHNLLRYVGGTMSIEMEIPKVLWLKNNMPKELFDRCKFYDLTDALEHLATGNEKRSYCSVVCKQGFVPVGVDGSVKGWQEDFLKEVGLEDLCEDNFKRLGGVDGVVSLISETSNQMLTVAERRISFCRRVSRYTLPKGCTGTRPSSRHCRWFRRDRCLRRLDRNRRRKGQALR